MRRSGDLRLAERRRLSFSNAPIVCNPKGHGIEDQLKDGPDPPKTSLARLPYAGSTPTCHSNQPFQKPSFGSLSQIVGIRRPSACRQKITFPDGVRRNSRAAQRPVRSQGCNEGNLSPLTMPPPMDALPARTRFGNLNGRRGARSRCRTDAAPAVRVRDPSDDSRKNSSCCPSELSASSQLSFLHQNPLIVALYVTMMALDSSSKCERSRCGILGATADSARRRAPELM